MAGEEVPWPQVQLDGKKKVPFDIDAKWDTFFKSRDVIRRNPIKSPIFEMPSAFDSSLEAKPSRQHGTLQNFFESCLSLEKYPNALADIENLLHQLGKEQKEFLVSSLHKKKTEKICAWTFRLGTIKLI